MRGAHKNPSPVKVSYYIEPVDETALAEEVPTEAVVVLVALTVVAIPIVVVVPTLDVVVVDRTFEPVEAIAASCGTCCVGGLPLCTSSLP